VQVFGAGIRKPIRVGGFVHGVRCSTETFSLGSSKGLILVLANGIALDLIGFNA
jgi:hypothetical protein